MDVNKRLIGSSFESVSRRQFAGGLVAGGLVAAGFAGSIAIAVCIWLTPAQVNKWQNSRTLFRYAIAVTENNSLMHNLLTLGGSAAYSGQSFRHLSLLVCISFRHRMLCVGSV